MKLEIKCFAKINLGLDVLGKREDGYHDIKTVMQSIDLFDTMEIRRTYGGVVIESNRDDLPRNEDNLVYKVWNLMKEKYSLDGGVYFYIDKNIPMGGGLAGGSSNAAGALAGINKLWNLNLDKQELEELGSSLGADIPFCLNGGSLLAEGIGDRFTKRLDFKNVDILLVNPNIHISTKDVYEGLELGDASESIDRIVKAIESKDLEQVSSNLYNKLEENVLNRFCEIGVIKEDIVKSGGLGALMSGSGSTVFGIFDNRKNMSACRDIIKNKYKDYIVVETKTL